MGWYGIGMEGWQHVGVGVEGQRDRAMAEQLLDHLRMNSPCQEMARRRVPEVVDSHPGQPSLGENLVERCAEVGIPDRSTRYSAEDQTDTLPA